MFSQPSSVYIPFDGGYCPFLQKEPKWGKNWQNTRRFGPQLPCGQQYPNSRKTDKGRDPRRQLVPRESPTDEENGRGHHHPKHPGEKEVRLGPIPAVDKGIPEERDDESDRTTQHDFEEGFHTW